jgi:hypothetical protein
MIPPGPGSLPVMPRPMVVLGLRPRELWSPNLTLIVAGHRCARREGWAMQPQGKA